MPLFLLSSPLLLFSSPSPSPLVLFSSSSPPPPLLSSFLSPSLLPLAPGSSCPWLPWILSCVQSSRRSMICLSSVWSWSTCWPGWISSLHRSLPVFPLDAVVKMKCKYCIQVQFWGTCTLLGYFHTHRWDWAQVTAWSMLEPLLCILRVSTENIRSSCKIWCNFINWTTQNSVISIWSIKF